MQKYAVFVAALFAAVVMAVPSAAMRFVPLTPSVTANATVQIRVRLVGDDGKAAGAVKVSSVRVDMSPDAMAGMTAPAKIVPSKEAGVVVVETNLYAPGRWAVSITGTADGKPVKGSVVITATMKSAEAASPPPANQRRILYYRNPMGLADTSPVPKKDAMGMAYIPVYADALTKVRGAVRLSTAKMQKAGVRTTLVARMALAKSVRATGTVAADETRQAVLSARFAGFVEKLYINQTGDVVRAGQPLMRVWIESPEVLIKEADYIGSLASGATAHAESAARLLKQYGIAQSELNAMAKGGIPSRSLTVSAPASGTVMEKNAVLGTHFASGDTLFKTTDLSRLWVLAEVSERDLSAVKPGQTAAISFRDDPSASFEGKVLLVYPQLDMATRTVKVRLAVANKGGRLRIGQFADVRIDAPVAKGLAVPLTAVIDDGTRQVAFVAKPGGLFEPRNLKLGARNGDMVEVMAGLAEGERVVNAGNFLIDAESNLQTALQSFKQ
jgi:membrane fusion protein, copper/silver efflux system